MIWTYLTVAAAVVILVNVLVVLLLGRTSRTERDDR